MDKTTWMSTFDEFYHQCYLFWKRQGCVDCIATEKALQETLNLKTNPYSPNGEAVDKKLLQEWYNNRNIYNYEH